MNKEEFCQIFLFMFVVGLIVWILEIWAFYPTYMWIVHHLPGWAEGNLRKWVKHGGSLLATVFIIMYFILQRKPSKVLLLTAILCTLSFLFFRKPNAEGYDMLFYFVIALVSGIIGAKITAHLKPRGSSWVVLSAWLCIITVSEFLQYLPLSQRIFQMGDIPYNMAGAGFGLLLSHRGWWISSKR